MLLEKIKTQRQEARASKDRAIEAGILTLLVGELESAQSRLDISARGEISDEAVIAAVQKLVKSNKETIKLKGEAASEKLLTENQVLSAFLPKLMDEDQIRTHISASGATDMKGIMAYMSQFKGQYDPSDASRLAKEYLSK